MFCEAKTSPLKVLKPTPLVLQEKTVFRRKLLAWYDAHKRPLPWRLKPSLYKTVVSEFMLQQTQVETVLPYFEKWIKAFPGFKALGKASSERVLKLWEGLGYYARARHLHGLAKQLAACKRIPTDRDSWLKFPGVGHYTAAAITSISFATPVAVVDGNVIRVVSRLCAEPAQFKNNGQAFKLLRPMADALLDAERAGDYNQALMELGATLCVRCQPRCLICPVKPLCAAFARGNPEDYPRFIKKTNERMQIERLWAIRDNALLLERAPKQARRLAEIFELPRRQLLGRQPKGLSLVAIKRRAISNQQIEERIFSLRPIPGIVDALVGEGRLSWIPLEQLEGIILSGPHRRWVGELLENKRWDS